MLAWDGLTFLRKPKVEPQEEKNGSKFDNKWLRARRHTGAPKPLALHHDDILTNSGAWKGGSSGVNGVEKVALPSNLKLNDAESAKWTTIHQGSKSCQIVLQCIKSQTITAINLEENHPNYGHQTILAEDLHDISCVEITQDGKWLAIGLDAPIWILQLSWKPDFKVAQIDHYATLEGHRENVCGLHFMSSSRSKGQQSSGSSEERRLLSVSHDRTFNIWSIDKLECLYESSVLGNYSFTSSFLFQSWKLCQILVIGNCDGKLFFFEIQQDEATKIDELKLNAGFLQSKKQSSCSVDNKEQSTDVQTVVLRAAGSKRKSGCKNSNNSKILLNGIACSTESSSAAAPPPGQENVNENSHQGCEVLDFMDLPMSPTSFFEPQMLVVGTTIGLFLININTREVICTISFDHLYSDVQGLNVLSAMVSTLLLSQSQNGESINVLTQCLTDERTAFFTVKFQSTIDQEPIDIIAHDAPKGFLKSIHRFMEEMSEQTDLKSKTLPSLSRRLMSIASSRKIKSSGYGKVHEAQRLFRPRLNRNRKSKSKMMSNSSTRPAWESNDEGFISPTSSLEDLSSSDSSDPKSRAKWKCPPTSKESTSKMLEKLCLASSSSPGPQKIKSCIKLWQTDGVTTKLFFAPNGIGMAASGAHNSVQVISSSTLLKLENHDDFTRPDALEKGCRLMGHIAPVNSVDFAGGNSDYLVTSGRDRAVKIWHWRSKAVKLNIDLRKEGRGTGLGKGSVFGSVYGGITAQANNSQLLQKKHKKSAKYDDSVKPFPDAVTQCQFYYMDQFLLSASSNQLFVHQLGLPPPSQQNCQQCSSSKSEDFWFKSVHQVKMGNCKNITAIGAHNQFYSHVVLIACSDKTLQIYDTNEQKIVRNMGQCHAKPVNKLTMGKSSSFNGNILQTANHHLFMTSAISDGAKLWDVRDQKCVQKFAWPGSNFGRMPLGVDICPNFQYFAGGSDDGSVYLYDVRKPCSAYTTRLMGGSSKPIPNHANHSNGFNRSPITDLIFHTLKPNVLIAATLNGELLKFE